MNIRVREVLAAELAAAAGSAALGHCMRVDDMDAEDAESLSRSLSELVDESRVRVTVLGPSDEGAGRISVETAVGIRNDKDRVFVLLVPAGLAHVASSLDNSFERFPVVGRFESVSKVLEDQLAELHPDLPIRAVRRAVSHRISVEGWLDYLTSVLDSENEVAFARELWRVGLLVDDVSGAEFRIRLDRNVKLVAAVVDPPRITATVRERLRAAGVAPGEVFEVLVDVLGSQGSDLRNPAAWTRKLFDDHSIGFGDIPFDIAADSDLLSLEMQSFRKADGTLESYCKLQETDGDGALFCQTSEDNPGVVGLRWKAKPPKPTDVAKWLLELLPPPDLRDQDTVPLLDMKVAGSKGSAQLKLELGTDDLAGNSLFVVRITALDETGTPILLSDGLPAQSESDPFEVLVEEAPAKRATRQTSATSLADAQLRGVLAGAGGLEVDMPSWDLGGQVFGVRIGKHLASQIRVASSIVVLQRRMMGDPRITSFDAKSQYGEPIDPSSVNDVLETCRLRSARSGAKFSKCWHPPPLTTYPKSSSGARKNESKRRSTCPPIGEHSTALTRVPVKVCCAWIRSP